MDSGLKRQLLVRADAGSRSGTGHVMRCMALAQQWLASGGAATFLSHCESEALQRRVENGGIKFIALEKAHPDAADLQTTLALLERMKNTASKEDAPWLVIDGYHFDSGYQKAIHDAGHRLLVIDDLAQLDSYHADLILNQNITADELHYHCAPDTLLLCGTKYALLRPEFTQWRQRRGRIPEVARKILVTLGGSDSDNITLKIIEALEAFQSPGVEVRIVVGTANPHYQELERRVESSKPRLQLVTASSEMPELMSQAELAISAAGTTYLELAFMGVPALLVVLADNQRMIAEKAYEMGVAVSVGDGATLCPEKLAELLSGLVADSKRRTELSLRGRALVDGKGAHRVVSVMMKSPAESGETNETAGIRVRAATQEDARLLWEWANDRSVRLNSFRQEAIPWDSHLQWYNNRLDSTDTRFWILEVEGIPVGHIRYDARREDESAEISFSVAEEHRGKGYGVELIERTCELACTELGVSKIRAVTFTSNPASSHTFLRAGFESSGIKMIKGRQCYEFYWQPVNEPQGEKE